jgi:acyl-CoA thioester hydrolase
VTERFTSRRGIHTVRVLYQDTDQARVVHHAAYFRYLEAGRLELWREQGFNYDAFEKETGLGLPVAETHMRYRAAARFDDVVEIETWVSVATRASVWFDATVRRGETVLVEARVRLACASFADGQIRRIPAALLHACLEPGHEV